MKNLFKGIIAVGIMAIAQSCSVNTDTTYFADSATSMQSNIAMEPAVMGMMSMNGGAEQTKSAMGKLTTEWKSLYDIQKDGLVNLNQDSVKVLKKLYMKLNKDGGDVKGISVKYDKLLPKEVTQIFAQSKYLRRLPMQNFGNWDGKKLTVDTEKFNMGEMLNGIGKESSEPVAAPQTKNDSITAYGKQMANGMIGMLKMFDMKMTSTMHFQKPIKSITGKSDYFKQIDKNTVQLNIRSKELMNEDKKPAEKRDTKIVIETE